MANNFRFERINNEQDKKKYKLVNIAYALKLSSDAIAGYFQNKQPPVSVRGGLTLDQISEAIIHGNLGNRGGSVDDNEVREIIDRLISEKRIRICSAHQGEIDL